jgi:hypothetical protein
MHRGGLAFDVMTQKKQNFGNSKCCKINMFKKVFYLKIRDFGHRNGTTAKMNNMSGWERRYLGEM